MVVDRKKILAMLKKAKDRMGKVRFLKKNSTTHLRVLEFKDDDGSKIFARQYVEHRKVGTFSNKGDVCRAETFDKPCAFCQVNLIAEQEGETKPFTYRTQYLVNAINVYELVNGIHWVNINIIVPHTPYKNGPRYVWILSRFGILSSIRICIYAGFLYIVQQGFKKDRVWGSLKLKSHFLSPQQTLRYLHGSCWNPGIWIFYVVCNQY